MRRDEIIPAAIGTLIALALLSLLPDSAGASERDHAAPFCKRLGGTLEHVLPDRRRVDCLTDSIAWEIDYAPSWAECIGQALGYSSATGREPGCVLIIKPGECRHLARLWSALARVVEPFHVETIGEGCL